jgi:MFS family permease
MMISIAGSQMQIWALFWQIRQLTDQPIALGIVGLVRIVPVIVFSLIAGAVADTLNRRKVLFITQSALMLIALMLAWLTASGRIALWQIYVLVAIQAIAVAFDNPARQAMVPNLVPAKDLPNAFSMNSIAMQTGSIVGPALSGVVIATLGQQYTYFFNALSFLAVLLALVLMGHVSQQVGQSTEQGKPKRQIVSLQAIREGIRFILNSPIILSTMIIDFFATFFASANTLMPFIAVDVLKVGEVKYGLLSAAQSIGAFGAALWMSQLRIVKRQGPVFLISVMIFGLATIIFGLSRMFWLSMLALIAIGAADAVSTVIRNTIRQLQTPDYIRGRMTSINQIFFMGGPQLGEVEAGVVAQFFGASIAVISGGIGTIVAVWLIIRKWPQLRHYDGVHNT